MGVSGTGKTTVGRLLAEELGWPFYEGDEFHPRANVEKMSRGLALSDEDRAPWLAALHDLLQDLTRKNESAVLSCSALKQAYRDRLQGGAEDVRFVYLKGNFELIQERLVERDEHFMKANLLPSQFAALEEPAGLPTIDVAQEPGAIVARIKRALGL